MFIAGIAVVIEVVGPALFRHLASIVNLFAPTVCLPAKIVLEVALLVVIPRAAGMLSELLLRSLNGRRNVETQQTMREKLSA
jgi:hypothetical protein